MSKEKVYDLTEVEQLKIENLSLKKKMVEVELNNLQKQMSSIYLEIEKRLGLEHADDCKFAVSSDMKTVKVVKKNDG